MADDSVGQDWSNGSWGLLGVGDWPLAARYGEFIAELRDFLDAVAGSKPDEETIAGIELDLSTWAARLRAMSVDIHGQVFGKIDDLPGRGGAMTPPLMFDTKTDISVEGRVRFGRFYHGGNGAVHGGAIPLLFDQLLGRLANSGGRKRSRTACLTTQYRAVVPIETDLSVRAWFVGEEGRKRTIRGEIRNSDTLCAEAEGLFVELKPGQP